MSVQVACQDSASYPGGGKMDEFARQRIHPKQSQADGWNMLKPVAGSLIIWIHLGIGEDLSNLSIIPYLEGMTIQTSHN